MSKFPLLCSEFQLFDVLHWKGTGRRGLPQPGQSGIIVLSLRLDDNWLIIHSHSSQAAKTQMHNPGLEKHVSKAPGEGHNSSKLKFFQISNGWHSLGKECEDNVKLLKVYLQGKNICVVLELCNSFDPKGIFWDPTTCKVTKMGKIQSCPYRTYKRGSEARHQNRTQL